ncbi:MAG: efflux transporter outer membrane subunit [Sinobacteraceae bacterium]|nr:efflux transporter outer membrane subunit [Nevskiaceae bacterium]
MRTASRCLVAANLLTSAAFLAIAGCAVGPDFHTPAAPKATHYTQGTPPEVTQEAPVSGGNAQHFITDRDIPGDWYSLFQSASLDELVRQALRDSPNVEAAEAALRSAHYTYIAERGALLLPGADGQFQVQREKLPGVAFGNPAIPAQTFTLYNATVNVTYRVDLFGASRRQLEQLRAQSDYQRWQLEAASLTLTGNVVTTAFDIASLREQLTAVKDVVGKETELYRVVQRQFEAGGVSKADVLSQQSQLAQAQALVPGLEEALAQAQHRLAVLAGRSPDDESLPSFELEGFALPTELPVSVPAKLVRQRPDVRSAEALLEQASAAVGVATANLYPQLNLSGSIGSESLKVSGLFAAGTGAWTAGGALLQPLFHGGELRYRRKAAIADLQKADANYRQAVLAAMQQVADTLRALEADARNLNAQVEAEKAAGDALAIARKQLQVGGISYITVLNAERLYLQARQNRVQAQAARYADSAALFQALGGGWWNRNEQKVAQQ